jgi:cell division protein FtsI (penicillin-binding protein 3)
MTPEVAAKVRKMLMGVVREGTAKGAALVNYTLGGKTGTARRVDPGHGYSGAYTASFVGLFPAENPEYVILVTVDGPRETIYGATAAAPVLKIVLEAAIASRDAALDRSSLATRASLVSMADEVPSGGADTVTYDPVETGKAPAAGTAPLVRFDLPVVAVSDSADHAAPEPRAIPDVEGLPVRQAVRELHRAGFRVRLSGLGTAIGTSPEAGVQAAPGTVVRLMSSR